MSRPQRRLKCQWIFVRMISPEPQNILFKKIVLWCSIMSQSILHENLSAIFKVKVTERAHVIKKLLFLLYLLNCWFFGNQTGSDDVSSDPVWLLKNQQFRRYTRKSYVLIIWALAVTLTLKIANFFPPETHSGSWCCITIPSLVTKCYAVQKISGHIFMNILNLHCKRSNLIFHRTLQLMMLYSLEGTVETVILWLYRPSL